MRYKVGMNWLIAYEPIIRLSCFLGLFISMLLWESARPARQPLQHLPADFSNLKRRLNNILLSILNTFVLRALPALSAVAAARYASDNGIGIFSVMPLPAWLSCALAILILDLCIYWQHRLFHAIPLLWRLHRVHHSDEHIDTTTAIRFHPVEIVLSMLIKIGLVMAIGAPVAAVILFEIILNAGALFNHGNVRLPIKLERVLRKIIVTPDMHRVHHSSEVDEMNSNYGFSFSIWDRWFKSYTPQPRLGHKGMQIGLPLLRGRPTQSLGQLLTQPLK